MLFKGINTVAKSCYFDENKFMKKSYKERVALSRWCSDTLDEAFKVHAKKLFNKSFKVENKEKK